jgi:antitoxin ParD1/3/4
MSAAEKISITLTPEMNRMIKKRVEAGEFGSTSELIREALRVWQRREEVHQENLAAIRTHLQQAIDDPRPSVAAGDVFDRLRKRHESRSKSKAH